MGRLGSDVWALASIAGGAMVGVAITAGLGAERSPSEPEPVACDAESSGVVVQVHGREDRRRPETIRIVSRHRCEESVRIDVERVRARAREARARAEVARRTADRARLRAEEVRVRMEEVRREVEQARIPAAEARAAAELTRELARSARIEAAERQVEAAARALEAADGEGDKALKEALQKLEATIRREAERTVQEARGGGDGG